MEVQLLRSGQRPLAFDGELVAVAKSNGEFEKRYRRRFGLALHRTTSGTQILSLAMESDWPSESPGTFAAVVLPAEGTAAAIETQLDAWERVEEYIPGYPEGSDNHRKHQAKLMRDLNNHLRGLGAELLAGAGIAERVE